MLVDKWSMVKDFCSTLTKDVYDSPYGPFIPMLWDFLRINPGIITDGKDVGLVPLREVISMIVHIESEVSGIFIACLTRQLN